jgi:hypothetical protein
MEAAVIAAKYILPTFIATKPPPTEEDMYVPILYIDWFRRYHCVIESAPQD